MSEVINDFVLTVATANGSGSQSSNNVLVRALFRMGIPVGGKNLFPSNIQGLPTWFSIRVNEQGFTARKRLNDVFVAMNPATASQDLRQVRPGGILIFNSDIKLPPASPDENLTRIPVPFKTIVETVSDSVKLKKLLINMVYVGVLAELLQIPAETMDAVVDHQFKGKASVLESNKKAISAGREYARQNLSVDSFPYRVRAIEGGNPDHVLIDGNMATGMGLLFGGCTVVAWYPITPSSSIVENFRDMASQYRTQADGTRDYAIVQAEDELAAISMVVGAGWAGARACTTTSGPGLSLMGEAAGLAYYAEIPAVIWDVQRVGPSTGLPTRTMQGDLLSAYHLSHGDTKHVVLLPGTPEECFEFGQTAFDLAERLQTLVIVLSDLDLGMNLHISKRFTYPTRPMDRGKVLNAIDLDRIGKFQRYKDIDGDGIPYRTLTGTAHPLAAYFTRGTGHDESGFYSESPEVYQANMERLARKFETARALVPEPVVERATDRETEVGILYYGTSREAVREASALLSLQGIKTDHLRLRALPFHADLEAFLEDHKRVYVVEQNRDAQLMTILRSELPQHWSKCHSILHYDGMPVDAEHIVTQILRKQREASTVTPEVTP